MSLLQSVIACLPAEPGRQTGCLNDLSRCSGHDRRQVLRVMDKLCREGYLVETGDNPEPPRYGEVGPPRRNPTWRVVRDPSTRPAATLPRQTSLRSKLWKLIRAKRRFTKGDLVAPSGASEATVDEYVRQLEKHGHVRRTGRDGYAVTYMLVNLKQIEPPRGLFGGGS
jgi:biotin operon repressor